MLERVLRCPTCKREVSADNPHFPFCGERCRLIDLGKWLEEEYAVPGEEVPGDDVNKEAALENENDAEE